jgi:hypothetical protein
MKGTHNCRDCVDGFDDGKTARCNRNGGNYIFDDPDAFARNMTCCAFRPRAATLPTDSAARKDVPLARGCLDYFPAALAEVARVSKAGNDQHNPGEEMHHARGKSTDHADCILRHLMDRGALDTDGQRHTAKAAWRALALLQEELEAAGAPMARGAK